MFRVLCCVAGVVAACVWGQAGHAQQWKESDAVHELFTEAGVSGTFVLLDRDHNRLTGHNEKHARQRFVPASTFKIPHTLIGLATEVVSDVHEVLPYGGDPQPYPEWEQDMSLEQAIKLSAVPIYQELAGRIGPRRMRYNITKLQYGNKQVGDDVSTFWLDGPLRISPIEQVRFLDRLARKRLPYDQELQRAVAKTIRLEESASYSLYGKTGWAVRSEAEHGWWVGWVETNGQIYPFALHMEMRTQADGPLRIDLGKDCLRALGLL